MVRLRHSTGMTSPYLHAASASAPCALIRKGQMVDRSAGSIRMRSMMPDLGATAASSAKMREVLVQICPSDVHYSCGGPAKREASRSGRRCLHKDLGVQKIPGFAELAMHCPIQEKHMLRFALSNHIARSLSRCSTTRRAATFLQTTYSTCHTSSLDGPPDASSTIDSPS